MMNSENKFIVRFPAGPALRFGDRCVESAADGEATVFDSPTEAAAAILRCCGPGMFQAGTSHVRGLEIVTVNGEGRPISLI